MKTIIVKILFILFSYYSFAQEQQFHFIENMKWADILSKSAKEEKLIFLDAYTIWCGPCKWMDQNIFNDKEVADFYNANFINVKMDMEQGEGIEFAKTYAVTGFPTFLFLNHDGKVIHQSKGTRDAPAFIELGKAAFDPKLRLAEQEARYNKGDRDPDFLLELLTTFGKVNHHRTKEILHVYLNSTPIERHTKIKWLVLKYFQSFDGDRELFKYLINNKDSFVQRYGEFYILEHIQNAILKDLAPEAKMSLGTNLPSITQLQQAYYGKLPDVLADQLTRYSKLNYARYDTNKSAFGTAAVHYLQKYPVEHLDDRINLAWDFGTFVDNKELLEIGKKWAKEIIDLDNTPTNQFTLARIYLKLGDITNAKKIAEEARSLAIEKKQGHASLVKFIKELEGK